MTHRHAFRRGVTPRPSDRDLRVWERLLKRAENIGDCGSARSHAFVEAAFKAAKAIAPVGHQHVASPFVQLVRVGQEFLRLPVADRQAAASRITALAVECRAALAAPAAGPVRRERKDIDG